MKKSVLLLAEWIFLLFGVALVLLPFLWMISTSLQEGPSIYQIPPRFFSGGLHWENYTHTLSKVPIVSYFLNSTLVSLMVTAGTLLTTILAAFAFSRCRFRGRDVLFTLVVATMMVPGEVLLAPNFMTITKLGLLNTRTSLYLPWIASAFSIFYLRQYFLSIPEELYRAAKADGASDARYLFHIMVPYAKPALISIALLRMINSWNEFLWPLLMVNQPEMRTLPVGLTTFMTEAGEHYQYLMAYASLVIIPIILIYLFLSKYILQGFARQGLKG